MKKLVLVFAVLLILSGQTGAQFKLKLNDSNSRFKDSAGTISGLKDRSKTAGLPSFIVAGIVFFFINPELVIENKKVYFGLTKEVSAGLYPFGRFAFEYTYVFRNFGRNQFRFSYNYDYIIETDKFFAYMLSAGVGYFTDNQNNGFFPQASVGMVIPLPIGITTGVYPYFRARHTFVKGQENSNITDFSFGIGLLLFY
jgi:hypothetical protein